MSTAEVANEPVAQKHIEEKEEWTEVIKPKTSLLDLRLRELWRYRDLVRMFVRRDFVATYKQTILGPLWFFIQPILTSLTYIVIFSRVARLPTDGLPPLVFYLSGITVWNYFSTTVTATSTIFRSNANIFGKVYFPRLALPLSIVISNLVRFFIQLALFVGVWIFFLTRAETNIQPNWGHIAITPILLLTLATLSLGLGMILSSLTTKYRDLGMLLNFGIQLLMYATPIIYPLSRVPEGYRNLILMNPVTSIVESFRYAFLGSGSFSWEQLGYSMTTAVVILLLGTIIFNKVQRSFMDTV